MIQIGLLFLTLIKITLTCSQILQYGNMLQSIMLYGQVLTSIVAFLTHTHKYGCLYLQSREFGEGNEPGEDEEWYYPEGQDYMSLIPRNIAVKVVYNWPLLDVTSLTI